MSWFSYFWNSGLHIEIFSLSFDTGAAIIEALLALWLARILVALNSKPSEEEERLKDKVEVAFGLIAAVFTLVAVASIWRIMVLNEGNEKREAITFGVESNKLAHAEMQINTQSNQIIGIESEYNQATNALNEATNAVNDAKIAVLQHLDRHLSNDQKAFLASKISGLRKETIRFEIDQTVPDGVGLADDINRIFLYAGWHPGQSGKGLMLYNDEGVIVRGNGCDRDSIKAIADALAEFGGRAWTNSNDGYQMQYSNVIEITIGPKPAE
jgi:hypothetical protein